MRGGRWSRLFAGRRVVVYLRISSDPEDERRGVRRQDQDTQEVVREDGGVLVWTAVEMTRRRLRRSASKCRTVTIPPVGMAGDPAEVGACATAEPHR